MRPITFYRIVNRLLIPTNLLVIEEFPRRSVKFAKKHFNNKKIDIIEIGVFKGDNADNIFNVLNVKDFYGIDPYEEYKEYSDTEPWMIQSHLNNVERIAKKKLRNRKIRWIEEYSDNALESVPKVDFIYIDGLHSYKQVKKDMKNYWSKLKDGGIMAGHDINTSFDNHGVSKAVFEFCKENNLRPYIENTDWWLVKK